MQVKITMHGCFKIPNKCPVFCSRCSHDCLSHTHVQNIFWQLPSSPLVWRWWWSRLPSRSSWWRRSGWSRWKGEGAWNLSWLRCSSSRRCFYTFGAHHCQRDSPGDQDFLDPVCRLDGRSGRCGEVRLARQIAARNRTHRFHHNIFNTQDNYPFLTELSQCECPPFIPDMLQGKLTCNPQMVGWFGWFFKGPCWYSAVVHCLHLFPQVPPSRFTSLKGRTVKQCKFGWPGSEVM